MDKQALNKKLAEWAGFEEGTRTVGFAMFPITTTAWQYPDGYVDKALPNFTNSLDACFKWLVPKLREGKWKLRLGCGDLSGKFRTQLICWEKEYVRQTRPIISVYDKDNPALALCLAISKLIDSEDKSA